MTEPTPDANRPSAWMLSAARTSSSRPTVRRGTGGLEEQVITGPSASLSCPIVVPFQPELAFGAMVRPGCGDQRSVVRHAGLSRDEMDAVEDKQRAELSAAPNTSAGAATDIADGARRRDRR